MEKTPDKFNRKNTEISLEKNKQKWSDLWHRIGAKGDERRFFDDIVVRYTEKDRAYHSLTHIMNCLDELESVRKLSTDPNAIETALWYHDIIYDTKNKDNEEKSAEFFTNVAHNVSLDKSFSEKVTSLILATKHIKNPNDLDTQLLVDIDLSILGQVEERFNEYEKQIRIEYNWVPEKDFISGRLAIIKSFLERPTIYSTKFFIDKYEIQARENLTRTLSNLQNIL